jgi:hypothetical protein
MPMMMMMMMKNRNSVFARKKVDIEINTKNMYSFMFLYHSEIKSK